MPKPDYDTTIARMAGNIAAALVTNHEGLEPYSPALHDESIAEHAVSLARAIVAYLKATQPPDVVEPPDEKGKPCHRGHHFSQGSEMGVSRIGQRCDCGQLEIIVETKSVPLAEPPATGISARGASPTFRAPRRPQGAA